MSLKGTKDKGASISKQEVIRFFDERAAEWDKNTIMDRQIINTILDHAGVSAGANVLDVACGTGILFPFYFERRVEKVTAVDISSEMIRIAREKFGDTGAEIICGDVESFEFKGKFDCIVVYNAFPHFPNPDKLIKTLSAFLEPGGRLSVAHGMSRAMIDNCHRGAARRVSLGLMHEDALAVIFEKYLRLETKLSDERMYQLVGVKE